ncbi:hypothetical protein D3C84_932920 [compost metagenome]
MHAEDGDQRQERQAKCRRADQQADDQGQTGEELGTTGQRGHQVTRCQADAFHVLRGARQAVAAKSAEEFLRTVGSEDDADEDPQDSQAVASAGKQYLVDQ